MIRQSQHSGMSVFDSSVPVMLTCSIEDVAAIINGYKRLFKTSDPNHHALAFYALLKTHEGCLHKLHHIHEVMRSRFSQMVYDFWTDLGVQLAFLSNLETLLAPSFPEIDPIIIPQPWDACNLDHCICMHPCHKMKVCKGCWRVKYCCIECQRA